MVVNLTVNGGSFPYPEQEDTDWGTDATAWALAISQSTLQKSGGSFTLSAEADFGGNYGLKALYFKSRTSNPAESGLTRLARSDFHSWRNEANTADLKLAVNSANQLTFDGTIVDQGTTTSFTNGQNTTATVVSNVAHIDVVSSPNFQDLVASGTGTFTTVTGTTVRVGGALSSQSLTTGAGSFGGALTAPTGSFSTSITAPTITGTTGAFAGALSGQSGTFSTTVAAPSHTGSTAVLTTSIQAPTITGTTGQFGGTLSAQQLVSSKDISASGISIPSQLARKDAAESFTAAKGSMPVGVTAAAGTLTFDFSLSNYFEVTLTSNVTSVVINNTTVPGTRTIIFNQNGAGNFTVNGWPAYPTVRWPSGYGPSITSSGGAVDMVTFVVRSGGTMLGTYGNAF